MIGLADDDDGVQTEGPEGFLGKEEVFVGAGRFGFEDEVVDFGPGHFGIFGHFHSLGEVVVGIIAAGDEDLAPAAQNDDGVGFDFGVSLGTSKDVGESGGLNEDGNKEKGEEVLGGQGGF